MNKELRQINFSQLRLAYQTVKNFIENESVDKVKSLDTKIAEDLGLYGDDNWEFLEKFVTTYNLDPTGFEYDKHFESEGELFGSGAALVTLISIVLYIPFKIIEFLSFRTIDFDKIFKNGLFGQRRQTLDLSFRDMLTWYIEGQYKLGTQVRYELKN